MTPSSIASPFASPSPSSKPTQLWNTRFACGMKGKEDKFKGCALVTSIVNFGCDRWFLDLGASHHMDFTPYHFLGLHPTTNSKINLGDSNCFGICGSSRILINSSSSMKFSVATSLLSS